jgi:DNA mismatch repair ATPase MutS
MHEPENEKHERRVDDRQRGPVRNRLQASPDMRPGIDGSKKMGRIQTTDTSRVAQPALGLRLFYGDTGAATVHLPGFSFKSESREGLRDVNIPGNQLEQRNFWKILESPPLREEQTLARQSVIAEMVANKNALEQLCQEISAGYQIDLFLERLFTSSERERQLAGMERREPKTRLGAIIESAPITPENFPEKFQQAVADSGSYQVTFLEPTECDLVRMLGGLAIMQQRVLDAIDEATCFINKDIKLSLQQLKEALKGIPPLDSASLLALASSDPTNQAEDLRESARGFSYTLGLFGGITSFAQLAIRDNYCQTTFSGSEAEKYRGAWNLLREKDESREGFGRDGEARRQIQGNSPEPCAHVALCGTNMSGKTFFLQRDLLIRLSSQSFGFAPAKQANIHLADAFIWVDRTSPVDEREFQRQYGRNPSDFGREIAVRNIAYAKLGTRSVWYADESWTTTSPNYEYRFNAAEDNFLAKSGARRFRATHNDTYLEYCERQADTRVYHFEAFAEEGDRMHYTRTLRKGRGKSNAFDVAKSLGINQSFLKHAEQYEEGSCQVRAARKIKKSLEHYTAYEREQLMKETKSFRSLIPRIDEIIVVSDKLTGTRLSWRSEGSGRYRPNNDMGRRDRVSPAPSDHEVFSAEPRFPFTYVSGNSKHFPSKFEHLDNTSFVSDLLYHGATADARELFERQQMFAELMKAGICEKFTSQLSNLSFAMIVVGWIGYFDLSDLSVLLLRTVNQSLEEFERHGAEKYGFVASQRDGMRQVVASISLLAETTTQLPLPADALAYLNNLRRYIEIDSEISQLEGKLLFSKLKSKAEKSQIEGQISKLYSESLSQLHIRMRSTDLSLEEADELLEKKLKFPADFLRTCRDLIAILAPLQKKSSVLEVPAESLARFLEQSKRTSDYRPLNWTETLNFLIELMAFRDDGRKPLGDILDSLRELDSVHLRQYANYLESVGSLLINPDATGHDLLQTCLKSKRRNGNKVKLAGKSVGKAALDRDSRVVFKQERERLAGLLNLSTELSEMARYKCAAVNFNNTGLIHIKDGWNITERWHEQVRNDRHFEPGQQIEFSTGANMSGKTFDGVAFTWTCIMAQATGWAPGREVSLPIFDRIVHIERVAERKDLNLSAFGTEAYYWRQILQDLESGGRTLLFADEPWSSASSRFRDSLNFAVAAAVAARGGSATIASHCMPPVEAFMAHNQGRGRATHLGVEFMDDGEFKFTHIKQEGMADSHAFEVAQALNFPKEIIAFARSLPATHEIRRAKPF